MPAKRLTDEELEELFADIGRRVPFTKARFLRLHIEWQNERLDVLEGLLREAVEALTNRRPRHKVIARIDAEVKGRG